jgi:shikimate dehydrogenase
VDRAAYHKRDETGETVSAIFDALPFAKLRAALVGTGIGESRTPWMHAAEGARQGLDYSYALIDFDEHGLPDAAIKTVLGSAADYGFAGLNVTHPFKQSIIPYLDGLSEEAGAIGAVNTVVFGGGRAVGHNTDCWGFVESFRTSMPGADLSRILLLGAGGAGKAVARALCELGAGEIDVFDIDSTRAAALAATVGRQSGPCRSANVRDPHEAAARASGLVNTTPVGMAKYPGMPIASHTLRSGMWVADIVYFPAETELLRAADAAGSRTMPGKGMAVFQAVKAFELFTGRTPDIEAMFRHFDAAETAPAPERELT